MRKMPSFVNYPEDFIVNDSRALPRVFDEDEKMLDLYGAEIYRRIKIDEPVVGVDNIVSDKTVDLWYKVVSEYEDAAKQIAALTLAWLVKNYGLNKPWPRDIVKKILPRDPTVLRYLRPLLYYAYPELEQRAKRIYNEKMEELRLAEILETRGFGIVMRAIELYNNGASIDQIMKELGLKGKADVYAILHYAERLHLITMRKKHRRHRRITKEELEQIKKLYEQGASIYEIARRLDRSVSTIAYVLKRLGLK